MIQAGPCCLCGDANYELSLGGPGICPACDAGNFHDEAIATKRLMGLKPPPTENEREKMMKQRESFALGNIAIDRDEGARRTWYVVEPVIDIVPQPEDEKVIDNTSLFAEITRIGSAVAEEDLVRLPKDGAENLDTHLREEMKKKK